MFSCVFLETASNLIWSHSPDICGPAILYCQDGTTSRVASGLFWRWRQDYSHKDMGASVFGGASSYDDDGDGDAHSHLSRFPLLHRHISTWENHSKRVSTKLGQRGFSEETSLGFFWCKHLQRCANWLLGQYYLDLKIILCFITLNKCGMSIGMGVCTGVFYPYSFKE